jgi:hypothetical protein
MKMFPSLGSASILCSIRNAIWKLQILILKTYQFKYNVKGNQILYKKLQISNLLIVERHLQGVHLGIVIRMQKCASC